MADRMTYGKRAVKRIEKRMNKGIAYKDALAIERGRDLVKSLVMVRFMKQILVVESMKRAAFYSAGKKFADWYMKSRAAKKAAKSIIKIAQNPKFDPIDVAYKIFD